VIVDVGDDLRLPRHHRIERRAPRRGDRIPEIADRRSLERPPAWLSPGICCKIAARGEFRVRRGAEVAPASHLSGRGAAR
jgi:hypothetical protein